MQRAPDSAVGEAHPNTLVASALAGGDCIDDADALRAGGTEPALGCTVQAPSTLGCSCAASGGATCASWIG